MVWKHSTSEQSLFTIMQLASYSGLCYRDKALTLYDTTLGPLIPT
jgi:hypothetical protein